MKVLTLAQSKEWLAEREFSVQESDFPSLRREYLLPPDSGWKTALARSIAGMFDPNEEVLLVLLNWDIWPSSCSMPLFNRVRLSFGETRPLDEAPGHLFALQEADLIEAVLSLTLYFVWEAVLVGAKGGLAFWVSHDEWLAVHAPDASALGRVGKYFDETMKLTPTVSDGHDSP